MRHIGGDLGSTVGEHIAGGSEQSSDARGSTLVRGDPGIVSPAS